MLYGVGHKFLKGHSEGQCHVSERKTREVNTVFASTAVGLNCLGNDFFPKIGGFPVLPREHVVSESQRAEAVLDAGPGLFWG